VGSIDLLITFSLITLVVGVILVWVIRTNNRLVRQNNQVRASWAQIDVQLRRRHDLVPNLVETVRGYAAHERGTLEAVVSALGVALTASAGGLDVWAAAESGLSQELGRLLALGEAHPDLKASENFAVLQAELASTEDKIAYARQFYNSAVQTLSNTVQAFPSGIIARFRHVSAPGYFEVGEEEQDLVRIRF
jgi:LemA protein